MSQLRAGLGRSVIETTAGGYRLDLDRRSIDLHRFRDDVLGAVALAEPVERFEGVTAVLDRSRGELLPEVGDPFAAVERAAVESLRLRAEEARFRAAFDLGSDDVIVTEVPAVLARNPCHEPLWGLLARSLYLAGRQAEAVAACQAARRHLIELGLSGPRQPLVDLEAMILGHDPRLER